MNLERTIGRHRIGGWLFVAATGELHRSAEVRRLEPRAAKALELLCEATGEVVSQERLIAEVWQGRALSGNSVAVVIGQLRRALDDDPREPRLIETIPKRGYRLRAGSPGQPRPAVGRPLVLALIAGAVLALAILAAALQPFASSGGEIAVMDVANATGDPRYSPVARATSELIVNELDKRGFAVRRDGGGDLLLRSKLVIWDGLPYLGMTATDRSGVIRWSSMSKATQGAIPPSVGAGVEELAGRFPPRVLRQRVADGGRRR